jgi:hypothetical protein
VAHQKSLSLEISNHQKPMFHLDLVLLVRPMILVHVATAQAILMVTVTLALIMFQRHTVILLVETLNLKQHV